MELAAGTAVENVDNQAQREPDKETDPGNHGQTGHQSCTKDNRYEREKGRERNPEAARSIRFFAAEKDHAQGNQNEGEKSTDVGQIGCITNIHEAGWDPHCDTSDPGGPMRSLVTPVDRTEDLWQQPVARHGKPNPGLPILENQQG